MSAMPSPSWSPIRSTQARDAAEAIEIEWQPLPHVIGARGRARSRARRWSGRTGPAISPSK